MTRHHHKVAFQSCISTVWFVRVLPRIFKKLWGISFVVYQQFAKPWCGVWGPAKGPENFWTSDALSYILEHFLGFSSTFSQENKTDSIFFILDIDISTNDQFSFMDFYYELCDKKIKVGRCYCNRNIGKAVLAIFFSLKKI